MGRSRSICEEVTLCYGDSTVILRPMMANGQEIAGHRIKFSRISEADNPVNLYEFDNKNYLKR